MPWSRILNFSSPLPEAPEVFWFEGSIPEVVVQLGFEKQGQPDWTDVADDLGKVRRYIIYHRDRPHIRAVHELGNLRAGGRREILGGRLEWEGLVSKRELRQAINLLDEFPGIEERGLPRGTRLPKRRRFEDLPITAHQVADLRKAGMDETDLKIFFECLRHKKQTEIARELKMSPPAITWRWKHRIEPALKKVNPKFSRPSLKLSLLTSK